MRIFKILKLIIQFLINGLDKDSNCVTFPNGLKICWGTARNISYGSDVTASITFANGYVFVLPWYNTVYSVRCTFSSGIINQTNTFKVYAYDTATNAASTYTGLAIAYLIIGY